MINGKIVKSENGKSPPVELLPYQSLISEDEKIMKMHSFVCFLSLFISICNLSFINTDFV